MRFASVLASVVAASVLTVATHARADEPLRPLRGRALVGAELATGAFVGDGSGRALGLDVWAGVGVDDRFAVLGFAQGAAGSRAGSFAAVGVGVRAWPVASLPGLSLEGRIGSGWRPTRDRDDPRYEDNDGSDSGFMAGASVISDLSRNAYVGFELRGTIATVMADYQDTAVAALVGVAVTIY